jgi:hypothetical protein
LVVVLGAICLTWREEVGLFFNGEGFKPSGYQYWMFGGLFLAIWVLVSLCASTLNTVKQDYRSFLDNKHKENSPPAVSDTETSLSPRDLLRAYYESLGYKFDSELSRDEVEDIHQPKDWPIEVWKGNPEQDVHNMYRRPGVVIYGDGTATQFSVAVLYAEDVWLLGSEEKVQRRGTRRSAKIATAIKRPTLQEMAKTSDYVVGVGLASWKPTRSELKNDLLAHARAFNIAVALLKQKYVQPDRISAVSFGHALNPPSNPVFEPNQRSVIVIGINASRDVIVSDVLLAAVRTVDVQGLNLNEYSHPPAAPLEIRSIEGEEDYISTEGIGARMNGGRYAPWVLPAVQ